MGAIKSAICDALITFLWVFSVSTVGIIASIISSALQVQGFAPNLLIITFLITVLLCVFNLIAHALGGASFNPTGTAAFYAAGISGDSLISLAARFPAQAAGAVGAALAIVELMPSQYKHMLGGPSVKVDLHTAAIAEGVLTFLISFAVLWIVIKGPRNLVIKSLMLAVTTVTLVVSGSGYTGPAMNPANEPTLHHFQLLKRVLRYLKATPNYGLPISAGPLSLTAYSDADWAGDTNTRRSTTGYCMFLGPTLISWKVHKQKTVGRSSTEAEYSSLAAATTEVIWLRRLLEEFSHPQQEPTPIFCDNTFAIAIASNPIFHARTKHVEIYFHFVRDHLTNQQITIQYISTHDQPADIFTKPHSAARFQFLRHKLTVRSPDTFEGG